MQFWRKYGTASKIRLPVVKAGASDFAVGADWTPATGDVKISKDGGAAANIGTLPTAIAMGNGAIWEFTISATEMQAAEVAITVVDAATKAVQDQALSIISFGNASAGLRPDFSDVVRMGLTGLANAAAGATGGLPLAVDDSGRIDVLKVNGTSQTARDLGAIKVPPIEDQGYFGDLYDNGAGAFNFKFATRSPLTGILSTLSSPTVVVYKNGSTTTETSTGITVTPNFDSVTGWNNVAINIASDTGFYAAGSTFDLILTTGTVDGQTISGKLGSFGCVGAYSTRMVQAGFVPTNLSAQVASAVWDVLITDHTVSGSFGNVLFGGVFTDTYEVGSLGNYVISTYAKTSALLDDMPSASTIASTIYAYNTTMAKGGGAGTVGYDLMTPIGAYLTGNAFTRLGAPAGASIAADLVTIDDYIDTEVAAIKTKTDQLVFTIANQVDVNVVDWKGATAPAMTGDAFARLGAPAGASVSADVAAVKAVADAVKAKTDNLPASPAAVGSAMTLTAAYDHAKGTSAMTESYATNGAAPTPEQCLFAIHQMLMQFNISGTSITVKKLDNATTAFVVTLNDATSPTGAVRT